MVDKKSGVMTTLELPHGPWKQVLSGVWDEREIAYYENPGKKLLVIIYDRKGEEVKGMALLMARFFKVKGNASTLTEEVDANAILFQKKTPLFKGSFLSLVTDPVYVEYSPRNLINQAEDLYGRLEETSESVRAKARNYQVELVDVIHSSPEEVQELFGEPLALPSIVVRKPGAKTVLEAPTGKAILGVDLEGKPARTPVKSFDLVVITGKDTRQAAHVVMEGCVMNGVPGLVFDDKKEFDRMDQPNNTGQFDEYQQELEPVSMPVRRFFPGKDAFIDVSFLNEKLFASIAGIQMGKTSKMVGKILETKKAKTLEEVSQKIMENTEESEKYNAARGARICRLLENSYPGLFNGNVEANEVLAPWMKRIGRVALVDTSRFDRGATKGIIYSLLKMLYENLKNKTSSEENKIEVVLEGKDLVSGKGEYIDLEINSLIKLCTSIGIGVCIRAPSISSVDKDLMSNATLKLQCIENGEMVVQQQGTKPFRVKTRPTISSS
jgi:hypothetical protein